MKHTVLFQARVFYYNNKIPKILLHSAFCWTRTILFVIGYIFPVNSTGGNPIYYDALDDICYVMQFNIFLLYLVLSAVINTNQFKYNLAIIFMIHNSLLILRNNTFKTILAKSPQHSVAIITGCMYLLECIFSIYFSFHLIKERNFALFKKIGVNPVINEAYKIRMCLETFSEINMFITFALFGKIYFLPKSYFKLVAFSCLTFTALSFAQQCAISLLPAEEDVIQRKTAIFLSFLKIPITFVLYLTKTSNNTLIFLRFKEGIHSLFDFIFLDIIILNTALIYYLIKDYKMFNSGLKHLLRFKTAKINLEANI